MALFYLLILFQLTAHIEAIKPKSVNLALETVLEFSNKENAADLKFLDNVQQFLDQVNSAVRPARPARRRASADSRLSFTDFIRSAVNILKSYDDDDLEDVFAVFDDEIRKYHYRGCKFYELIEDQNVRRFVANKLDRVKEKPAAKLRKILDAALAAIESDAQAEFLEYVDTLYRQGSDDILKTFLRNLHAYSKSKRANLNLVEIVRDGIRSVLFDHYSALNANARRDFKIKLETSWKNLNQPERIEHRVWTVQYTNMNNKVHPSRTYGHADDVDREGATPAVTPRVTDTERDVKKHRIVKYEMDTKKIDNDDEITRESTARTVKMKSSNTERSISSELSNAEGNKPAPHRHKPRNKKHRVIKEKLVEKKKSKHKPHKKHRHKKLSSFVTLYPAKITLNTRKRYTVRSTTRKPKLYTLWEENIRSKKKNSIKKYTKLEPSIHKTNFETDADIDVNKDDTNYKQNKHSKSYSQTSTTKPHKRRTIKTTEIKYNPTKQPKNIFNKHYDKPEVNSFSEEGVSNERYNHRRRPMTEGDNISSDRNTKTNYNATVQVFSKYDNTIEVNSLSDDVSIERYNQKRRSMKRNYKDTSNFKAIEINNNSTVQPNKLFSKYDNKIEINSLSEDVSIERYNQKRESMKNIPKDTSNFKTIKINNNPTVQPDKVFSKHDNIIEGNSLSEDVSNDIYNRRRQSIADIANNTSSGKTVATNYSPTTQPKGVFSKNDNIVEGNSLSEEYVSDERYNRRRQSIADIANNTSSGKIVATNYSPTTQPKKVFRKHDNIVEGNSLSEEDVSNERYNRRRQLIADIVNYTSSGKTVTTNYSPTTQPKKVFSKDDNKIKVNSLFKDVSIEIYNQKRQSMNKIYNDTLNIKTMVINDNPTVQPDKVFSKYDNKNEVNSLSKDVSIEKYNRRRQSIADIVNNTSPDKTVATNYSPTTQPNKAFSKHDNHMPKANLISKDMNKFNFQKRGSMKDNVNNTDVGKGINVIRKNNVKQHIREEKKSNRILSTVAVVDKNILTEEITYKPLVVYAGTTAAAAETNFKTKSEVTNTNLKTEVIEFNTTQFETTKSDVDKQRNLNEINTSGVIYTTKMNNSQSYMLDGVTEQIVRYTTNTENGTSPLMSSLSYQQVSELGYREGHINRHLMSNQKTHLADTKEVESITVDKEGNKLTSASARDKKNALDQFFKNLIVTNPEIKETTEGFKFVDILSNKTMKPTKKVKKLNGFFERDLKRVFNKTIKPSDDVFHEDVDPMEELTAVLDFLRR